MATLWQRVRAAVLRAMPDSEPIFALFRTLRADLAFWLGVAASLALLSVPQISTVLWQLGEVAGGDFRLFAPYLLLLTTMAVASILYVVPPAWTGTTRGALPIRWRVRTPVALLAVLALAWIWISEKGTVEWPAWALLAVAIWLFPYAGEALKRTLDRVLAWALRQPRRMRAGVGVGLEFAALALLAWPGGPGHRGAGYRLAGSTAQLAAVAALFGGAWLVVSATERGEREHGLWRSVGRVVLWLAGGWAFGEAIWCAALLVPPNPHVGMRLYTAWAALELVATITIVGTLVDRWQAAWPSWPIRVVAPALGLAVAFATCTPFAEPLQAVGTTTSPAPDENAWLSAWEQRLEAIPRDDPAVFVAASGGGSRAAIFSALVYETLAREPFPEVAKSSAAGPTTWADHVVLVSGVSGGSLGSALFVHGRATAPRPDRAAALRNANRADLLRRMRGHIERQIERVDKPEVVEKLKQLNTDLAPSEPTVEDVQWILRNAAVDDAGADFMAPILRGALAVNVSRAESLWQFWTERFEWGASNSWGGYAAAEAKPAWGSARTPLAIFNAANVAAGRRLALGFPHLPAGLFDQPKKTSDPLEKTVRFAAALDDAMPPRAVGLAQAVGMSANFPFGFNVVRLPAKARGDDDVRVIDGGVVDNTGIDTIKEAMQGMRRRADDAKRPAAGRYRKILTELGRRGILLVEIDSGAKPGKPGAATRWLSVALEPLAAMNNSAFAVAEESEERRIADLQNVFRVPVDLQPELAPLLASDALEDAADRNLAWAMQTAGIDRVARLRFICNHLDEEGVMTAWSLGPSEKALTLIRFLIDYRLTWPSFGIVAKKLSEPLEAQSKDLRDRARKLAEAWSQRRALATSLAAIDTVRAPAPNASPATAAKDLDTLGKDVGKLRAVAAKMKLSAKSDNACKKVWNSANSVAENHKSGRQPTAKDRTDLVEAYKDMEVAVAALKEEASKSLAAISPEPSIPLNAALERAELTRQAFERRSKPLAKGQ